MLTAAIAVWSLVATAQPAGQEAFRPGAKVYIGPLVDGFDVFLKAALRQMRVPLTVVELKADADLEIAGLSLSKKASITRLRPFHSDEVAAISVTELTSGELVFAYDVNKINSAHGKRSTAEACAKHLKAALEKKMR